jgi:hypothetical protein
VGAIVLFNISNPGSLKVAKEWKSDIDIKTRLMGRKLQHPISVILLSKVFV